MGILDLGLNNKKRQCTGEISVDSGVLSVDCMECPGRMELHDPECFRGLSRRMIPGFRGPVVLKGEVHRYYEGSAIESLSTFSQIYRHIKNLGRSEDGSKGKLHGVACEIESELFTDPVKLIERKDFYLNTIRKTLKTKNPPEEERFLSIIESVSRMVRRLERGAQK